MWKMIQSILNNDLFEVQQSLFKLSMYSKVKATCEVPFLTKPINPIIELFYKYFWKISNKERVFINNLFENKKLVEIATIHVLKDD